MRGGRRSLLAAGTALALSVGAAGVAVAANPIITNIYTADPAALVVGSTMYVYAGHDQAASASPPGPATRPGSSS